MWQTEASMGSGAGFGKTNPVWGWSAVFGKNEANSWGAVFAKTNPVRGWVLYSVKRSQFPIRRCSIKRSQSGSPPVCFAKRTQPHGVGSRRLPASRLFAKRTQHSSQAGALEETKPIFRPRCPPQNQTNLSV